MGASRHPPPQLLQIFLEKPKLAERDADQQHTGRPYQRHHYYIYYCPYHRLLNRQQDHQAAANIAAKAAPESKSAQD